MNAPYTRVPGRRARPAAALLVGVLLAGCGNLTAGGYGETEVYASGDAPEPAPAPGAAEPQASMAPAGAPPAGAEIIGLLEGDMTVDMDLFIRTLDGAEVRLTPSAGVDLTLGLGDEEEFVDKERVPAGAYEELRVVVREASADVVGGLVIDTLPFVGTVDVQIGPAGLDVVLPIAFVVPDGGTVALDLDFNAREWLLTLELDLVNPLRARVTAQAFADALTVGLR